MKKLVLLVFLLLSLRFCTAQVCYVRCADDRSFATMVLRLQQLGARVTSDETEAELIVDCVLERPETYKKNYKGSIILYDRNGTIIARTKTIKRKACAANGFNASADIFQVLVEGEIPAILEKIKSPAKVGGADNSE